MNKLLLVDGNSILNRAFYGIMGSKMLMTSDGMYTNAIYGFLAILFKILDDIEPEYLVVTFDLKVPTARHKMYEGYKATRKGMPNELAEQMPIMKDILRAMNITIIEKEGYEADDVIGTLSVIGEKAGLDVTILSGDRDNFQLATEHVTVRIPRTKAGKTETEDFNKEKIIETYGVEPKKLIEVKGLMGDNSDNIPGVPGVGEKTALNLVKEYGSVENLYKELKEGTSNIKGKLREKLEQNEDLAILSKKLGTINLEVPIEEEIETFRRKEWNKQKVLEIFQNLKFNRYIERFKLEENAEKKENIQELFKVKEIKEQQCEEIIKEIKKQKEFIYYLGTEEVENNEIIKERITDISIALDKIYYFQIKSEDILKKYFKEIFEDKEIKKIGYKQKKDYILLKQMKIDIQNLYYDIEVAAYILNPTAPNKKIEDIIEKYLNFNPEDYKEKEETKQMNLFEQVNVEQEEIKKEKNTMYAYSIKEIYKVTIEKLKETNQLELFKTIEMPVLEVLADMQYQGIYVDKEELIEYGQELKQKIEVLVQEIHQMCGEEFNINSTKQLGEVLFEKLKLPVYKKNKSGYSTDVDVLEKLQPEHPVIEKILEYRQLVKLNSTYVEGLIHYINPKTNKIHSYFHQTVTATGRISSTDPNLQNIPTRIELGKG